MSNEAAFRTADNDFIKTNSLAALTFLVYDILLLLPHEVEFVWKQRWSGGKLLYIWNRCFGLSAVLFDTIAYFDDSLKLRIGLFFPWWSGMSIIVGFLTIESILQARIFAVYEGNRKLLFVMAGFFLATSGATLFLFIKYVGMYIHLDLTFLKWYPYLWVPSLVFEAFLCLLMAFKAVTLYKNDVRSPLLIVLIRDSIIYFVIVLITLLVNCLGIYLRPSALGFGLSWALAVPCALGSRLLLNMRREYFGDKEHLDESGVGTLSGWHAAPGGSGVQSSAAF